MPDHCLIYRSTPTPRLLTLTTKSPKPVTRLSSLPQREARHPSTPALEMPSRTTPSPRSSSPMPRSPSRSITPSRFVQSHSTLQKFSRLISCSFVTALRCQGIRLRCLPRCWWTREPGSNCTRGNLTNTFDTFLNTGPRL